jgi:transposase InsO family protein
MDSCDLTATPVRLRLRGSIDDLTERLALRAALTAAHLFGLATGILRTVGKTVRPTPPITRFADVVRHAVQMMGRFGTDETTARVLTRAGWRVSERSVRRICSEKPRPAPVPPHALEPHRITHPVIARFVNHTWMMDVTEIQAFLGGGTLYLATVFDAFSRVPLVVQGYQGKPGASAMAKLLKTALRAFGKAKYVVTDRGKEFTGKVFEKTADRLGIQHRLGTKDRLFATARLEGKGVAPDDSAFTALRRPRQRT